MKDFFVSPAELDESVHHFCFVSSKGLHISRVEGLFDAIQFLFHLLQKHDFLHLLCIVIGVLVLLIVVHPTSQL